MDFDHISNVFLEVFELLNQIKAAFIDGEGHCGNAVDVHFVLKHKLSHHFRDALLSLQSVESHLAKHIIKEYRNGRKNPEIDLRL